MSGSGFTGFRGTRKILLFPLRRAHIASRAPIRRQRFLYFSLDIPRTGDPTRYRYPTGNKIVRTDLFQCMPSPKWRSVRYMLLQDGSVCWNKLAQACQQYNLFIRFARHFSHSHSSPKGNNRNSFPGRTQILCAFRKQCKRKDRASPRECTIERSS